MQLATVYVLAASNNDEKLVDTRTVDFARLKSSSRLKRIGSLISDVSERHTSTGSEPFSLLIYLDATKFVLLSVFTLKQTICLRIGSKVQKVHFRLTCVAQKRRCFNSLINKLVRAQSYLAKFITDLPPEIPHDICFYPIDPKARAGIVSKVY